MPDFWIATMLLLALTLWIGWLPEFGYFPLWEDPSRNLQALIFPAVIVGYRLSATASRMTRSAMLEVLREDYVRTARAKGLQERTIVIRHALKNALIPVITIFGGLLSFMLGGLVVIETIFALPGMGRLALNAVLLRDYPVLQGTVMVMAVIFVAANLIVDLSYAMLDRGSATSDARRTDGALFMSTLIEPVSFTATGPSGQRHWAIDSTVRVLRKPLGAASAIVIAVLALSALVGPVRGAVRPDWDLDRHVPGAEFHPLLRHRRPRSGHVQPHPAWLEDFPVRRLPGGGPGLRWAGRWLGW